MPDAINCTDWPNYSPPERHEEDKQDVPETLAKHMKSVFHDKIYSKFERERIIAIPGGL